ncbi:MAG: glycerol-3-phosphate acyltransferase [Anaerolineae bacterium]|nr:glycerol-3-phosphate acyltransferase [Anaerolineae bacterium]
MKIILAILIAYLLGSIPPGLFWAWIIKHIDVRQHGSGRTGGTNVWRTAGFGAAFLTALFDCLKAVGSILIAQALGVKDWGLALVGTAVILGHNYSLYLKFRGGAGTVASIGVAAAFWPLTFLILVIAGVSAAALIGHASVASILIALLLPVLFLVRGETAYAVAFGIPTMVLTLWALRPNIQRLIKGEERFLPVFWEKPPLLRISRHPAQQSKEKV